MAGIKITFHGSIKGSITKYQLAEDFRKMSRQELAKECRRVFDIANKRINRIESLQIPSPALHSVMKSGGKFYTKGLDLNHLSHEYARCVNFLNMDTSTVTGSKSYVSRIESKLGTKLSEDQYSLLFQAFRSIEHVSPAGIQAYGSDRLIQYLANEITSEDSAIMAGVGSVDFEAAINKALEEILFEYEKVMSEFDNAFRDSFSF